MSTSIAEDQAKLVAPFSYNAARICAFVAGCVLVAALIDKFSDFAIPADSVYGWCAFAALIALTLIFKSRVVRGLNRLRER